MKKTIQLCNYVTVALEWHQNNSTEVATFLQPKRILLNKKKHK